jgi:hypothetical protein
MSLIQIKVRNEKAYFESKNIIAENNIASEGDYIDEQ